MLHVSAIVLRHADACWCRDEEGGIPRVHILDIIRHIDTEFRNFKWFIKMNFQIFRRVAETH